MTPQQGYNPVKNQSQDIDNLGLDREFNVPFREVFVHNPVTDTLERMVQPGNELPTAGNNPSTSITESTVGTVTTTTIQKTIGAATYQQTIAEDSSDNSVTISSWSEI